MITSTQYRNMQDFQDVQLPIRLHESSSMDGLLRLIGTGLVFAILLIAPPAIVYAMFVLGEADFSSMRDAVYRFSAISFAMILMALVFLRVLFVQFIRNLGRRRVVTINETQVAVREQTLFNSTEWHEPLTGYHGVESVSRATVGGWQHKLILSHALPERQVSLWIGDQVPDSLVAGYQALLSRSSTAVDQDQSRPNNLN